MKIIPVYSTVVQRCLCLSQIMDAPPPAMEQQQYCLKWNNHPKNIATVFDNLREDELFVDVTLATSDKQVRSCTVRSCLEQMSTGTGPGYVLGIGYWARDTFSR